MRVTVPHTVSRIICSYIEVESEQRGDRTGTDGGHLGWIYWRTNYRLALDGSRQSTYESSKWRALYRSGPSFALNDMSTCGAH